MKRLMLFALGGLLSTTAMHAKLDIVENAIKDSDVKTLTFLTVIGTTHNNSFAVTEEQKAAYTELAKIQVEKCQSSSCTLSYDATLGLDWLSIIASGALAASAVIGIVDTWSGKDDKKVVKDASGKVSLNIVGHGALLLGLGNTIKSVKDLFKHITEHRTKAKKDLKKAEEVLKLVEAMPVKAA